MVHSTYSLLGGVAQLGERLTGSQEVRGSIPLVSTRDSDKASARVPFFVTVDRAGDRTPFGARSDRVREQPARSARGGRRRPKRERMPRGMRGSPSSPPEILTRHPRGCLFRHRRPRGGSNPVRGAERPGARAAGAERARRGCGTEHGSRFPRPAAPRCRGRKKFKKVLASIRTFPYIISRTAWGRSSAGRALDWQSRGQGFDPPRLHPSETAASGFRRLFSYHTGSWRNG